MNSFSKTLLFVLAWFIGVQFANADITLPKLFSDHMVLQRDSLVRIWGTAEPDQELSVTFEKQVLKTKADAEGNWSANIRTGSQAGGPFQLEVAAIAGEPKVIFSDVMVGEVWLCVGGRNMSFPVSNALNSENEVELSKNFNNLRLFNIAPNPSVSPLADFNKVTPWTVCAPETVKDFSATAYFFGREVSKQLEEMPIGLIQASTIGATCESFCSRPTMDKSSDLAAMLKYWDEIVDPTSIARPGSLYNGMIAPIRGFPCRGVIWYQGEANSSRGEQYSKLFPMLINDWRTTFNNQKMPFYFVQLCPHQSDAHILAELWDAQLKSLSVSNTGMVVTTDIGDTEEIEPKNKQEIGRRLSLLALSRQYLDLMPEDEDRPKEWASPIFESHSSNEERIRIVFKHTGGELKTSDGEEELTGFTICGEDKKFVPAAAMIVGDAVEVSSPDVKNPLHVRFGWEDTAQPNLINAAGLPASPFRTDKFSLQSEGRDF